MREPRWVRAIATWLVIFPSVVVGQWLLSPVDALGPVARAAVITAIVVPLAVYVGTPAVLRLFTVVAGTRPVTPDSQR